MSEQESIDLSKVIGLIMENPALIEQISGLVKQSKSAESPIEQATVATEEPPQNEPPRVEPTYAQAFNQRTNRAQLLGALKPYVSKERAKAIDSMISIADILEMMKTR